jgi:hypothetical protein
MNGNIVRSMALISAFGLAACGEDTVVPGELNEAEVQDLAGVIMQSAFTTSATVPAPAATVGGPQLVPYEFSSDVSTTAECPLGGEVAIVGELTVNGDTETESATIGYGVVHTHNACRAESEQGREFTLWGNPDMDLDFSVVIEGDVIEWGGFIDGNIDWQTDGKEGTCSIAYEFNGRSQGDSSIAGSVSGSVCGIQINQEINIG